MLFWILYFSGILVSIILILILAYHFKKEGDTIEDLPASIYLSLLSWVMVVAFIIIYKQIYLNMLKNLFKNKQ